ncbi:transcription initiation factor IIB 2, partial [Halobacteriales archaeon QH_10_67_13]
MTDTTTRRYAREKEQETEEEQTEADEQLACPECGGNLIVDEERGETVC